MDKLLDLIKPYLPENPVIVEAGAFDGGDSVLLAKFWPKGHVYSFEPVPELYNLSLKNISRCGNIKLYQKALSDVTGRSIFYVSSQDTSGTWPSASSSLLPPKEHLIYHPQTKFPRTIEVETISLDDWASNEGVSKVDFFWLDMQGYELNTLQVSELALKASVIFTEVLFVEAYAGQYLYADTVKWMNEHGFKLLAVDFDESNLT